MDRRPVRHYLPKRVCYREPEVLASPALAISSLARRPLLLAHRFVAFQMASFKAQYASWKSRPEPEYVDPP